VPGLAVIAHTVWGAAGSSLHDPRNRLGDALGRRLDLAVAVESGRITAVVPAAEVAALGADRVVDLGDATLMPGFVDAHVHLSATGLADHGADLRQARSVAELLDRVRAATARAAPEGLLWGDGYDETRFEAPELPSPRPPGAARSTCPGSTATRAWPPWTCSATRERWRRAAATATRPAPPPG
jgi:formylmethanofuran dehydrogenase subunit A